MSRADEIKDKAKKQKTQQTNDAETKKKPAQRAAPQVRVKTIRRTVDLKAEHHRSLDAWCAETARELGRARVTGQDALRTLVARLLTDETLARKIKKDLSEDQ